MQSIINSVSTFVSTLKQDELQVVAVLIFEDFVDGQYSVSVKVVHNDGEYRYFDSLLIEGIEISKQIASDISKGLSDLGIKTLLELEPIEN